MEDKTLVEELRHALELQEEWFHHAWTLLEDRSAYRLLLTVKGIGPKVAVGILSCVGPVENYNNGKQWVRLAGLDLRLRESGTSVHALPVISRQGKSVLRTWLYHAAMVAVRYDGPFRELYERRPRSSPGRGAKARALIASPTRWRASSLQGFATRPPMTRSKTKESKQPCNHLNPLLRRRSESRFGER